MNEEELFCKLFPEYVVNGKPLSPYFDLFESGFEQAENQIAELKAELKAIDEAGEDARKHITESFRNKKPYWELEKELTNAKEIIKLLLWDLRNHSYNPEKDMARAEEFLGRNK